MLRRRKLKKYSQEISVADKDKISKAVKKGIPGTTADRYGGKGSITLYGEKNGQLYMFNTEENDIDFQTAIKPIGSPLGYDLKGTLITSGKNFDYWDIDKEEYDELKNAISRFVLWSGVAADFVGHTLGEEMLEKYMTAIGEVFARPRFKLGPVDMLKSFASSAAAGNMELTEDDQKIQVKNPECGSGGRMEREGYTRKFTSGKYKGMTPYCVHCPLWWHKLAKEWYNLDIEFRYGDGGKGCTWTYYKKK